MAQLQGDDQPPDSTFDECYILPQSNRLPYYLKKKKTKKKQSCQNFAKLNQKAQKFIYHMTAALNDFHTANSRKSWQR